MALIKTLSMMDHSISWNLKKNYGIKKSGYNLRELPGKFTELISLIINDQYIVLYVIS